MNITINEDYEQPNKLKFSTENEKLLHFEDIHNNFEFEKLVFELSDESTSSDILSDITSGTDSDAWSQKFIVFCYPNCCWNIQDEALDLYITMDSVSEASRNFSMLDRHTDIMPCHRTVLLDWLMEICEFFKVSRDTYSQTIDYIDRFLSGTTGLTKSELQLIGITCLHISNKMEEVMPIRLTDLIFMCDNIVREEDILSMERKILEAINWRCYIWPVNKWLFFIVHQAKYALSKEEYVKVTDLIDLVTFDIESLKFSHGVLAYSSFYLVTSVSVSFPRYSAMEKLVICECIFWMKSYWDIIKIRPLKANIDKSVVEKEHRCKVIKYDIGQRYGDLIQIYSHKKKNEN